MVYTDGIHMVADTLTELHLFALKIGVKRCWYHGFRKNHPHYDLMGNKLDLALSKGAIKVCSKKVVEISKMSIINDKKVNDFLKEVSNPKVLIAAPTSSHKDYIFEQWSKSVKSLTYPADILLIDNSQDKTYVNKLRQIEGFKVLHVDRLPGEDLRELMCRCNNIIRAYAILGGYDYIMSLETDVFTPKNIIEHLLSLKKKVVGLSYFLFNGCFSRVMTFEMESFGYHSYTKTMNVDMAFWMFDGNVKPVYQLGLGCLLIRRDVFEKVEFRIEKEDPAKSHADTYFHSDLKKMGIPVYCDTKFMARHINGNWHKIPNQ